MRLLATDSRDIRRMGAFVAGPIDDNCATVTTPSYAGPSGMPVTRIEITTAGGAYATLASARPGEDTIPAGTRIRVLMWWRGDFALPGIATNPNGLIVASGFGAVPSDDWTRLDSDWMTTLTDWLPSDTPGGPGNYQRLRAPVNGAGTIGKWGEVSDPVLVVGN